MNGEELRYGNYVYSHRANGEKVIHQHFDFSDDVEGYKPIPLTENWLKKFGFKYQSYCDNYILNKVEIYISPTHKGFLLDQIFDKKLIVELNFVHQLQNLFFALTNEELILNNENTSNNI